MEKDQFAGRAPYWDSPDKVSMSDDFVAELLRHIDVQKQWKALEIGSGTGLVGLRLLPRLGSLLCVDSSESMLAELEKKLKDSDRVDIVQGVAEDYKDSDIDFVFSNMSFHHIDDIDALLQHLYKIMHSGGYVAVGDLLEEDGSFHKHAPIPHRGFDVDKLGGQFAAAGFRVESLSKYRRIKRKQADGSVQEYGQFLLIAKKA